MNPTPERIAEIRTENGRHIEVEKHEGRQMLVPGAAHAIRDLLAHISALERSANFHRERGITLLDAKWLDPECHKGCQSLVLKDKWKQQYALTCLEIECVDRLRDSLGKLVDAANTEMGDGHSDIGGRTGPALIDAVNALAEVHEKQRGPVSERLAELRAAVANVSALEAKCRLAEQALEKVAGVCNNQLIDARIALPKITEIVGEAITALREAKS